jgi:hypothetical protein
VAEILRFAQNDRGGIDVAFTIRQIAAARDAIAITMDNLKKYPHLAAKLNSQLTYLPEGTQDIVAAIMRARMDDDAAANVTAIFDRFTCSECGKVGRACKCKQAEAVA